MAPELNAAVILFQPGEVLIVQPADGDDPEATLFAGKTCTFLRYAPLTRHCVVRFEERGKPMYFRSTDLKRVTEGES